MKRVMVDQGSAAEIMYPDLYRGLSLKTKDLTPYSSPLVSFEGKIIIPKGQIRLPVQTGSEMVEVDFIVVDAYSPYTTIVARPWLHNLGAVFPLCTKRLNTRLRVGLKKYWEIKSWRGSAWSLPSDISLKLYLWLAEKRVYSS